MSPLNQLNLQLVLKWTKMLSHRFLIWGGNGNQLLKCKTFRGLCTQAVKSTEKGLSTLKKRTYEALESILTEADCA